MGDFFKSTSFKILIAILIVLVAFMLRAAWTGGSAVLITEILGVITSPIQKITSSITGSVMGFFDRFANADRLADENEQLRGQLREMSKKLVDYDRYKQENEQLKAMWGLNDKYPDWEIEPAFVIARDSNDRFGSFTIDKGTIDGLKVNDPVITPDGLVGIVSETGLTLSKVITLLDVSLYTGGYVSRTRDVGVITGDIRLSQDNLCKLIYLDRDSEAARDDIVITAGTGGVFPEEIVIGTIIEVRTESHGISLYAVVKPAVDIRNVKDVIVIKSFEGQGSGYVSGQG